MKNEELLKKAWNAAWDTGERVRLSNQRLIWTEEEIDAAALELKRRLLATESDYGLSLDPDPVSLDVKNQVFPDPADKSKHPYRVMFNGRMCSATFTLDDALTHLDALEAGTLKPEWIGN